MDPARQVIVALDVDSVEAAEALVDRLGDAGQAYKIGLELLTSGGPDLAKRLALDGRDVFLDLKLFEIPNSVAGAIRAAGRLGASMVTVHAMGGTRIMRAAVAAASEFPRLRVLGLTVVTSMSDHDLAEVGVREPVGEQVRRLARLAREAGCHGVVASSHDAALLREQYGPDWLIVTPGIRLHAEAAVTDHARSADPVMAIRAGATHIVLGRSVTSAADPRAVLAGVHRELVVG